jgi:indolepyruvate ferredoxin oxidoreductase
LLTSPTTRVRLAGIGGTGVVTAAQVLATAAMLDGLDVRGLDQTGLSQKAGPVVSDLSFGRPGSAPPSNHIGLGEADLLIAFDALVGAADGTLEAADPQRTRLIGSTTFTPTGSMVVHPHTSRGLSPDAVARLERSCQPDPMWLDATATVEALGLSSATANLFVLGAALQAGLLPISPSSLDEAIVCNGVAVDANRAAVAWGRGAVGDPDRLAARIRDLGRHVEATADDFDGGPAPLAAALESVADLGAPESLLDLIDHRAGDLCGFQDVALALDYLSVVGRAADREQAVRPGAWALTEAIATELYRVLAVKDEYEVSRLLLDERSLAEANAVMDGPVRVAWALHPPVLRSLGVDRKITVGTWAAPLLRVLAAAKRVRATRWDLFGRTKVRRAERAFAAEYRRALERVLGELTEDRHHLAVEIATLPDSVRGYEQRKLDAIARFETSLAESFARW